MGLHVHDNEYQRLFETAVVQKRSGYRASVRVVVVVCVCMCVCVCLSLLA